MTDYSSFIRHLHFTDAHPPQADALPIAVADDLYADGERVIYWGSSAYPLGRWEDADGILRPREDALAPLGAWQVLGGREAVTAVTLYVPAELIEVEVSATDPRRGQVRVWGRPALTPPFDEYDLPAKLAAARAMHSQAPVEITLYVAEVSMGGVRP